MMSLQIIWFILILVLLAGYAVLDGFDLGSGFWHIFTKEDKERRTVLKAIGPFWDGNEVWLLTGGGAIFAAFPPVYAATFSGFYLAMILVVFGLIFRAVSVEFRNSVNSILWKKIWDFVFFLSSTVTTVLFGVAIGNIVKGLPLDDSGNYTGSFFDLLHIYPLFMGLTVLSMFVVHGAIFLLLKTEGPLREKIEKWFSCSWGTFLVFYLVAATWSLLVYQRSMITLSLIFAVLGVIGIIGIKFFSIKGKDLFAFFSSSLSIIAGLAFVASSIYPYMVPMPIGSDLGLSIFNSSSSQNTLTVMLVMALIGMPIVIIYTAYIYRTFKGKV